MWDVLGDYVERSGKIRGVFLGNSLNVACSGEVEDDKNDGNDYDYSSDEDDASEPMRQH